MVPGQTPGSKKYPSYYADPSDPTGSLTMQARPKSGWKRKKVLLPVGALIALVLVGVAAIGVGVGVKKKNSIASKSSTNSLVHAQLYSGHLLFQRIMRRQVI